MEQYVKSLYDRLEGDKEKQGHLFIMMDRAGNEMVNNNIVLQVTEEAHRLLHDPDPEIRIGAKTTLAKTYAYHNLVKRSQPVAKDGKMTGHMIEVLFDPRFADSLAICIQGGLEGLYQGFLKRDGAVRPLEYTVFIRARDDSVDVAPLTQRLEQLAAMYPEFTLHFHRLWQDPKKNAPEKEKKKGFFSRLFGKKESDSQ